MDLRNVESIRAEIEADLKAAEEERVSLYRNPGSNIDPQKLILNVSYPYSEEYDYETKLINLNLDEERIAGLRDRPDKNMVVTSHLPIQKQQFNNEGFCSPEFFGGTIQDANPYIQRYRCKCGKTEGNIYEGTKCPYCGGIVKFLGDDFGKFMWFVLKKHYVIHPNLYKDIECLVGGVQALTNILSNEAEVDEDGHILDTVPEKPLGAKDGNLASKAKLKKYGRRSNEKKDIYDGKGMTYFYEHFDEICLYYYNKSKSTKQKWYDKIMEDREKVFTHSIPVYTTHLRPIEINNSRASLDGRSTMAFEGTNANYNMMSKLVFQLNSYDKFKFNKHSRLIDGYLWSLQREWNDLYTEIDAILDGKKGNIRLLAGGRCNFSGRSVIIQNPKLRADQIILPYPFLVTILQQQIINILHKTYNISYNDARNRWERSVDTPDKVIVQIIYGLIRKKKEGLPVIINRNPSIARGSLLQMFCIDMSFDYTMSLPLTILEIMGADFDKQTVACRSNAA